MKAILFLFLLNVCAMTNAQTFNKDVFETKDGKNLSIFFIKHSSLVIEYENRLIYVDPVSMFADFTIQPKADVILITHEHADHYDPKAIEALKKEGTLIVLNEATQKKLGEGESMNNGDTLQATTYLSLKAVPAYNTTPEREIYHPKSRDNGYVLTAGGLNIYIAGDTENIPEMEELKNIDIAFLPVNQPYTMTVDQAVKAAKVIKPNVLYPYHYNGTKVEEISGYLGSDSGIEVRIRDMQ